MSFIEYLKKLDTDLFLFLNGHHHPFMDEMMYWFSHKLFWIPLYVVFLYLVIRSGKKVVLVILAAGVLITLTDQGTVHFFKNVFLRYRPCHNLNIHQLVHVVYNCGGKYGFISSHAANTFGLAMFLSLLLKNNYKYLPGVLFIWATLVSYSRIYTGQHYPADILIGALYGILIALIIWRLYHFVNNKLDEKNASSKIF